MIAQDWPTFPEPLTDVVPMPDSITSIRVASVEACQWGVIARLRDIFPHPYQRLAVVLWSVLIVAITLRVAIAKPTSGTVFPVYRVAGEDWLHSTPLYTLDFSKTCFRYHPIIAVSFVPWTALPEKTAAILWRWLGASLLLAGMWLWVRKIANICAADQRGLFFVLVVPLTLPSLNNAQANVHLIGLILLGLWAAADDRWTLAAALIAAATAFKLYPIAVGLLMVAAYPRQFGLRFALMLGLGFAIPFLAQRPSYVIDQYALWFQYLHGDNRHNAAVEQTTRDLYLLIRVWFGSPAEWSYQLLQAGTAIAMGLCCIGCSRAGLSRPILLGMVLHFGSIWMTLLGPSTESSTYTMLGPTAALLLIAVPQTRPRWQQWLAWLGYGLLIAPLLAVAFPEGKRLQLWGPQPLGAMVLLLVYCLDLQRVYKTLRTKIKLAEGASATPESR